MCCPRFGNIKFTLFLYGLQKQKMREDSEMNSTLDDSQKLPKLIRSFPQTQPVADFAVQNKPRLSTNVLAGVSNNVSFTIKTSSHDLPLVTRF